MDKNKDFEAFLLQDKDVEDALQQAQDDELLQEIHTERKKIKLKGVPHTLIFEYPDLGISLKADRIVAEFKATELRAGKLLTSKQLKAIARQPTTAIINGKEEVVDKAEWTVNDDQILDEYPRKINDTGLDLIVAREEYQEVKEQLDSVKGKEKEKLEKRRNQIYDQASKLYSDYIRLKRDLLDTQLKEMRLLNGSLEELANLEKLRYLAPKCIKKIDKDGKEDFIWKTDEDFQNAPFDNATILSVFNVFLRGGDISFFGVVPEEPIS